MVTFSDLDVAFQAIVNIHSGQCFGHEVLVRGWERLGFASAQDLLSAAAAAGRLPELEIAIRTLVAERAAGHPVLTGAALFLNFDPRAAAALDKVMEATRTLLQPGFAHIVTEISGLPEGGSGPALYPPAKMRREGGMVAVDRFGGSADSFNLLISCDPDFIKIDRAFIRGIESEARKRVVLAQLIGMAHTLGIEVIAVGVETGRELTVCRELGLDLVQGFYIAPPETDPAALSGLYSRLEGLAQQDRRRRQIDQRWVTQQMDQVPAIINDAPIRDMFDRFARDRNTTYVPVVDRSGRPLGIVREGDLKNYAYSAFGKDLIANKALGRKLQDFVVRCPIADIATPLDQMLAIYAAIEDAEGILITEHMIYHGFLTARSLIRAMHEKTLARARDENPLTKLPGNVVIEEYVADCTASGEGAVLAYIDFDNFKPFNDTYGFRQGDRAILLFAELCRKTAVPGRWFVGHIGGDDFFVAIQGADKAEAYEAIGGLIARFASDAESFYDHDARARRCIIAQDRDGNTKRFPLLSASAVLAVLPPGCRTVSTDELSSAIALYKKAAKSAPDKLVSVLLPHVPAMEPA
ncbi:bifunctional diguanylate cyclase/phosphodiesterase [Magnetospirillum fulvum]|uniref:Diguanylate cyclase/phosphodiesterase n=1 Tax=Magnetospirillum fulvum TaxID=1082 RepID=A0A1H6HEL7_MAGFU|nr:bifunctional diguanylate cyclase/phosphodiesterase [Magnetospirillum fulvum]SEH32383.1 diguanylate cyclase/phosphodiesterase [Magnetospirillum fulvum]